MPITVKHLKVSTVPDAGDDTLVEPSDWNADHTLTGLGTMAEQNANAVAITGGTISGVTIPASNVTGILGVPNGGTGASTLTGYVKGTGTTAMTAAATIPNTDITGLGTASTKDAGAANGVATLDAGGKVPVSELPAAVLGALSYQGTWDASTNTPTLTSSVGTKGYYYVVSVAGNTNLNGITDWLVGDWAVYNGTVWQKVDNTETVTSVNGQTGAVSITLTNLGAGSIATQNANAVAITGGAINGTTIGATTASTGAFTTATASTSVTTPIVQATNSAGLSLRNSAGTSQISMGAGGGDNVTIAVSTNLNGTNAQIDISPTGTGHVHIKPSGSGAVEIAPTNAGTMNNMVIGGTTPLAGSFTNLSVTGTTSFDGSQGTSGQVLTSQGTGVTPIWTTPTTGTVTSVTGTAPVVSSGGATPAISLAAGYGDTQNPYASKTANNFLAAPNGSAGAPTFRAIVAADIPTLNQNTTGTASNVTGIVAFANGGTGETTRQAAMDALAGAVTSGQYLRGNGTDVVMSAIQVADVPTLNQNTTGNAGTVTNGVYTTGSYADPTWITSLAGSKITGTIDGGTF
jgi:hypothetical protein